MSRSPDVPEHRPFAGSSTCTVYLPLGEDAPYGEIGGFRQLLIAESPELEAELGCPVRFAHKPFFLAPFGPALLVGPARLNPAFAHGRIPASAEPTVRHDAAGMRIVIDGPSIGEVGTAFQLLRTALIAGDAIATLTPPTSPEETIEAVEREVWHTYPAFALRNIAWSEVMTRHRARLEETGASLTSLQMLFADLHDAHTWVKDGSTNARPPYRAWIDRSQAYLTHVPTWSEAWRVGVRAGDELLGCDRSAWCHRTAATPRTHPLVTGLRWLSGTAGEQRSFCVKSPNHGVIEWRETLSSLPWINPVSWRIRPSGTAYLRTRGWLHTAEWTGLVDNALTELAQCPRLIVDLRGNIGGNLVAAQNFRNRFLSAPTTLGSIQFSIGHGRLSGPAPIVGQPNPDRPGWTKPVRLLIDRQTYSATEDAILGLETLPNVEIVGEPSGGGSGRPRTIALHDGMFATISTALTYTTAGQCVESHGIPVSLPLPIADHLHNPVLTPASAILDLADRHW